MMESVALERANGSALTGWERPAVVAEIAPNEIGAIGTVAQAEAEIKAAVIAAKHFPRDEHVAFTKIMKACERPAFAERAAYSFPRGGQTVSGPSVNLSREMARSWGNMRSGLRIVAMTEDEIHIKGWAYDLEANNYAEMEDRFARLVQRKRNGETKWVAPDERDLRELVNRRGAICERNATLKLLPPDVVEIALTKAKDTLRKAAAGELEQNREDAIRRLALAFDRIGVSTAMLEKRLGHTLDLITADEIADLREVYTSIADGNSRREEHFEFGQTAPSGAASPLNETIAQPAGRKKKSDPIKDEIEQQDSELPFS